MSWKAKVEKGKDRRVKTLQLDSGEYVNHEFKDYCAREGIKLHTAIPGKTQQVGVAESMVMTLNKQARGMLSHARLPETLWAEAINTSVHLINRSPCTLLDFQLLEEV